MQAQVNINAFMSGNDARLALGSLNALSSMPDILTVIGVVVLVDQGSVFDHHHVYHEQLAETMKNGSLATYLQSFRINEPKKALLRIYKSLENEATTLALTIKTAYKNFGFDPADLSAARQSLGPAFGLQNLCCEATPTSRDIEAIYRFIAQGIRNNTITLAQVLTNAASMALRNPGVCVLINAGIITVQQVLALTNAASMALRNPGVRDLIRQGTLPLEQVLVLTEPSSWALIDSDVRAMIVASINAGTVTISQWCTLTDAQAERLMAADTQRQLRNGQLTMAHIIGNRPIPQNRAAPTAVVINDTHRTSQGVFFPRRVADELGSIRHHSSEDQERYDQQFALVPR